MSGKVIAYGCVVSGFRSTKSADKISETEAEWRLHTKVADEIKKLRDLFVSEDVIRIDVIDSIRRRRNHLEDAVNAMGHGDTIIIASLNSLGTNNDEIVKNYKRIYKAKIGLLLPDYSNTNGLSGFATTNFAFDPITIAEEEFAVLCKKLSFEEIKSYRGRKMIDITEEFKQIYWAYERYAIDPTTTCKNKFFTMSKNTFRRLCDVYEKSKEYEEDLEEQESCYSIHALPKRYGVISPELEAMIHAVAGGADFEDACSTHGITINLTHFMRIYAKFFMPKKIVMKITNAHRDCELIESLQPSYEKTS
jgi:hypothetical protein